MACLRKRNGKWQVQIRRQGHKPVSKTFITKNDALIWARGYERDLDRNIHIPDYKKLNGLTLGDLLHRYIDQITVKKRGAKSEFYRISKMMRHKISEIFLGHLQPHDIATYRDDRLKLVNRGTVKRELNILHNVFKISHREWGIILPNNPVDAVAIPKDSVPRTRRLHLDEESLLLKECIRRGNLRMRAIILFALETAMRRGEIVNIKWSHLSISKSILIIPHTKTGHARTIPLSNKAMEIITSLHRTDSDNIFCVSGNAIRLAWQRIKAKVGISDLRFHDLRHEAISRLFEKGLSVAEVLLISGHKDPRMLFRYTHLQPENIVRKLNSKIKTTHTTNSIDLQLILPDL